MLDYEEVRTYLCVSEEGVEDLPEEDEWAEEEVSESDNQHTLGQSERISATE